jgi:aspartyl-tRNA(Asn)/glutamyl-tRNA(Gln) amidotransferase subunit C
MTDLTRLHAHEMAARLRTGETTSRELAELDTDAIAPTAQTIELENILREDVVTPSLPVEEVLRNAPATADGYLVSPPILSGE